MDIACLQLQQLGLAMSLEEIAYNYPAIDNHAHPLCKNEHRLAIPFEGVASEAGGSALVEDSIFTLASYRACRQLAKLYNLEENATWEDVKTARATIPYDQLCDKCLRETHIQCLLLDDGLGGVSELCHDASWHDRFTKSPTKRIVRVETVAQDILKILFDEYRDHLRTSTDPASSDDLVAKLFLLFSPKFNASISASAVDPQVAGFKSVACYRTGLNISTSSPINSIIESLGNIFSVYIEEEAKELRLEDKTLNDWIVRSTLEIAGRHKKPVQFHTGLGDNDITLTLSSPAHMQPIIKAFPDTIFVILHSSYPYTRDAGYLTSVYSNVYLDFGEIFPMVSADGQRAIIRQVLELCPTNKIMWSTDGHWWPESFYLGTIQARQVLYEVLSETVQRGDLSEEQACSIVKRALFENANRVYNLGLSPIRWTTQA